MLAPIEGPASRNYERLPSTKRLGGFIDALTWIRPCAKEQFYEFLNVVQVLKAEEFSTAVEWEVTNGLLSARPLATKRCSLETRSQYVVYT